MKSLLLSTGSVALAAACLVLLSILGWLLAATRRKPGGTAAAPDPLAKPADHGFLRMLRSAGPILLGMLLVLALGLASIGFSLLGSVDGPRSQPGDIAFRLSVDRGLYEIQPVWQREPEGSDLGRDAVLLVLPYGTTPADASPALQSESMETRRLRSEFVAWGRSLPDPPAAPAYLIPVDPARPEIVSFRLPESVDPGSVRLFYAHGRAEPMDLPELWFREIRHSDLASPPRR
ncbi:hypothetical protein B8V81_2938 [Paenibacillus pasadenensis]|uniref:Uncharacterized protein n=1 Tax=Paenibacillus pasadenensis TaxID=217090 RepID=A0A2N5N2D1_9BACL|nr:hypothetical protein [Paenibacillus pasadenensis]PLT44507.1 hypothetical protein B8V81_2938 [Paenibacillus pasadenensis]